LTKSDGSVRPAKGFKENGLTQKKTRQRKKKAGCEGEGKSTFHGRGGPPKTPALVEGGEKRKNRGRKEERGKTFGAAFGGTAMEK